MRAIQLLKKKIDTQRMSMNKIITEKNAFLLNNYNEKKFKNSMSFTEIFDDLSSHFSILINSNHFNKENM